MTNLLSMKRHVVGWFLYRGVLVSRELLDWLNNQSIVRALFEVTSGQVEFGSVKKVQCHSELLCKRCRGTHAITHLNIFYPNDQLLGFTFMNESSKRTSFPETIVGHGILWDYKGRKDFGLYCKKCYVKVMKMFNTKGV